MPEQPVVPEAPRKPPFIVAAEEEPEVPAEPPPAEPEQEVTEAVADDDTRFPEWAKVPDGIKFPAGVQLWFVPLDVRLMRKKTGGEAVKLKDGRMRTCRQLILWELSLEDQRRAFQRAGGDPNRAASELAIQMIRAIDGQRADWAREGSEYHPRRIWTDMGPKYRDLMQKLYTIMHVLVESEIADFFGNCVELKRTI